MIQDHLLKDALGWETLQKRSEILDYAFFIKFIHMI